MNGDSFNPGIRIFSHASYKLTSVITAFGFYTRITGKMIPSLNAQGLNAGLSFNLKTRANTHTRVSSRTFGSNTIAIEKSTGYIIAGHPGLKST